MNPTEISDALGEIVAKPYDPSEFGYAFALATDTPAPTVMKLRSGSYNKSDLSGGVLMNQKFHFAPAAPGEVAATLERLRNSKRNLKHKPAILIATDGVEIAAEHPKSGDRLYCAFAELGDRFGFFLPAAGKERYRAAEENPVDIKVAGRLAKLYDALIRRNPDWASAARRHDMNQMMTRLIFCMFAEDVGIFPDGQFSRLIFTHSGNKGEGLREALIQAFMAMNTPEDRRAALPVWTREFAYVNGGLFAGAVDAPIFDASAARYLRDVCNEDWKGINPDIFGSMIQSVADAKLRSELGMHYTSVPNILKVLGPLFLDDLDAQIEKAWDRQHLLRQALDRISKIRVFDPACGSGNFLVVAYRELREREIRILERLDALNGGKSQVVMWSAVTIRNFHGIELTDFGAETAKLALFIAEYQANARFQQAFGRKPADLPLRDAANIVCDNALRVDWEAVCPVPKDGGEVFIAGNPPFLGSTYQSDDQKNDLAFVFSRHMKNYASLDFVAAWFFKASHYIRGRSARAALVSTNSICQGQSVAGLWPHVLSDGVEIGFAHKDFKWRNNASANAAVICSIVGVQNPSKAPKRLFVDGLEISAWTINAYLTSAPMVYVDAASRSIFDLPFMTKGNQPTDGGALILSPEERDQMIDLDPRSEGFIRKFMGSMEVVRGLNRYCLWITDEDLPDAMMIDVVRERVERVRNFRLESTKAATRDLAERPFVFAEIRMPPGEKLILVPSVTSERRPYLPFERVGADTIASNLNFALYDAPDWCMALIGSRLHLVWIGAVCGRLKSDFRYSNTLGWNTFPVPKFTEDQLAALNASARRILRTRYEHYPATIADLYDPKKMPEDLRAAHKANDDLLEGMYIGRPFRNDTERLEHLFKLYAARVAKLRKGASP